MRLLVLTGFYPPHVIGGWEQLVQDLNQRLQARGYATAILCSNHGVKGDAGAEDNVFRQLYLESELDFYDPVTFFTQRRSRTRENARCLRQVIADWQPDIVFVHGMWNLSRLIAWQAEQLCPGRVIYYVASDWPYGRDVHRSYWTMPACRKWRRFPKKMLGQVILKGLNWEDKHHPLRFDHVLCVSHAIKEEMVKNLALSAERVLVVYNGIDVKQFAPRRTDRLAAHENKHLALLYAGSIAPHKGVHTAIQAQSILVRAPETAGIELTVVGSGHQDYMTSLQALARSLGVAERVHFVGRMSREAMPELMRRFDVLVFPSVWDEPLARVMQEAMASGLVIVGTTTGGSKELLVEGVTGLTFAPEDAAGLAQQIARLNVDRGLAQRLACAGRRAVEERFSLDRMVDEFEDYMQSVVTSK